MFGLSRVAPAELDPAEPNTMVKISLNISIPWVKEIVQNQPVQNINQNQKVV